MAYSYTVETIGDTVPATLTVSFQYLLKEHVGVMINGVEFDLLLTDWNTQSVLSTARMGLVSGDVVRVYRTTPTTTMVVNYQSGADTSAANLDSANEQLLYIVQESTDKLTAQMQLNDFGLWDALGIRLTNLIDPVDANDAATKDWVEHRSETAISEAVEAAEAAEAAQSASQAIRDEIQAFFDTANASGISYDPSAGRFTAVNVQAALDESDTRLTTLEDKPENPTVQAYTYQFYQGA